MSDSTALDELLVVLDELGLVHGQPAVDGRLWIVDPAVQRTVVAATAPTTGELRAAVAGVDEGGFVVADRLAAGQRRLLTEAGWGWWDRRGELSVLLRTGPVALSPKPLVRPEASGPTPFQRASGRGVALALLHEPHAPRSVRELAAATGESVGAVGRTISELRELGLLRPGNRPEPHAVFDRLVAAWQPRWHGLRAGVGPTGRAPLDELLRFGLAPGERAGPGWAATSVHALGQDRAGDLASDHPLRLFAVDDRAAAWALRRWGTEEDEQGALQLAVPPTAVAVQRRRHWPGGPGEPPWLRVVPIALAVTLAADPDPALARTGRALADELLDRGVAREALERSLPGDTPVRRSEGVAAAPRPAHGP